MIDDIVVFDVIEKDGSVEQKRVPSSETKLHLHGRQLVAVTDNVAQLTRVKTLSLPRNAFVEIPAGVLALTQLTFLDVSENRLVTLPREIGRLTALTALWANHNKIVALPREIGLLRVLENFVLNFNSLKSLPSEVGELQALKNLHLNGNPLPIDVGRITDYREISARPMLSELFLLSTALGTIREAAIDLLVGIAAVDLPALLQVEILDEAFPNSIPMHKKWDLVVAVKHFHQRRGT